MLIFFRVRISPCMWPVWPISWPVGQLSVWTQLNSTPFHIPTEKNTQHACARGPGGLFAGLQNYFKGKKLRKLRGMPMRVAQAAWSLLLSREMTWQVTPSSPPCLNWKNNSRVQSVHEINNNNKNTRGCCPSAPPYYHKNHPIPTWIMGILSIRFYK